MRSRRDCSCRKHQNKKGTAVNACQNLLFLCCHLRSKSVFKPYRGQLLGSPTFGPASLRDPFIGKNNHRFRESRSFGALEGNDRGSCGKNCQVIPLDKAVAQRGVTFPFWVFTTGVDADKKSAVWDSCKGNQWIQAEGVDPAETFVGFAIVVIVAIFALAANHIVLYQMAQKEEGQRKEKNEPPVVHRKLEDVVKRINDQIPPPFSRKEVRITRKSLAIPTNYRIHLDIGGEGYHEAGGLISGFRDAININDRDEDSQPPFGKIPLLVRVPNWAECPSYPFEDYFADCITMQGAPLTDKNVEEIARCLRCGGEVGLWIDVEEHKENINKLAELLQAKPEFDADDEFEGEAGFPKIRITSTNKDEL